MTDTVERVLQNIVWSTTGCSEKLAAEAAGAILDAIEARSPATSMDDGEVVERAVLAEREACAALAEKWRDENKAAAAKARRRGIDRYAWDGDETQSVMAEQLDGAAIECNAIAQAIRGRSALSPPLTDQGEGG